MGEAMDRETNDYYERGLIERGDGAWRADKYPMPRIDDILDKLKGAKYFSKLDLTDGFYHIFLDDESMGLVNSPAEFQRRMDRIFGPFMAEFMCCYIDDLIIYSNTFEEHLIHLEKVFSKLQERY